MTSARALAALLLVAIALVGCSKDDPLDKAAAPVTATDKQPPAIPGKKPTRAPPLAGPNAGKDIFAGAADGNDR